MNSIIKFLIACFVSVVFLFAGNAIAKSTASLSTQHVAQGETPKNLPALMSRVHAAAKELGLDSDHGIHETNETFFDAFKAIAKRDEPTAFLKSTGGPRNTRVPRSLEQVRILTQHEFSSSEPRSFVLDSIKDTAIVIPINGNANIVLYRQDGKVMIVEKGHNATKINPPMGSLVPFEFHATTGYRYEVEYYNVLVSYVIKRFYELQRVRKGLLEPLATYALANNKTNLQEVPGRLKGRDQVEELALFKECLEDVTQAAASIDGTTVLSIFSDAMHRSVAFGVQKVVHNRQCFGLDEVLVLRSEDPNFNTVLARRTTSGRQYIQIVYPDLARRSGRFANMNVELFSLENPIHLKAAQALVQDPLDFSNI